KTDSDQFVVDFTKARILLARGRVQEAVPVFRSALSNPASQDFDIFHFDALTHAFQAAARCGLLSEAKTWCIEAIRRSPRRPDRHEFPELLAELGWLHFISGDLGRAAGAMFASVRWISHDT